MAQAHRGRRTFPFLSQSLLWDKARIGAILGTFHELGVGSSSINDRRHACCFPFGYLEVVVEGVCDATGGREDWGCHQPSNSAVPTPELTHGSCAQGGTGEAPATVCNVIYAMVPKLSKYSVLQWKRERKLNTLSPFTASLNRRSARLMAT